MSAQRNRDRIYKRSVGVLVIFSVLALLVFLRLYQQTAGPFRESFHLIGSLQRVDGVNTDTPVTLAGIKVGRVVSVVLTRDNRAQVDLQIERRVHDKLGSDSLATLNRPLIGAAFFELSFGSIDQGKLADGATISMRRSPDLNDLVATLPAKIEQVDKILANLQGLTEELRATTNALAGKGGPVERTLNQVAQVAEQAGGTVTRLNGTIDEVRKIVGESGRAMGQVNTMLEDIQPLSTRAGSFGDSLARTLDNVEAATADLRQLTPQLQPVIAAGQNALEETDTVLRAAQNNFLLRGSLPPAPPPPGVPSPRP